ncbi:MAG TPA: SURF1 family protein [Actinomycetales bacterium]
MLRTALQPRWLALLALILAMCALFGWLGSWQLAVARDNGAQKAAAEAREQPVVPVQDLLPAQQTFPAEADGRAVSASGTYDPERQVLVPERLQDGISGWWVVTALRTTQGALLPVVRGWVPSAGDPRARADAVPGGRVSLTGVLQPDDAAPLEPSSLPPGQLAQVDAAVLVNLWGGPIHNGYVLLTTQDPATTAAQPVPVPPPSGTAGRVDWRNVAYAVQWWVFGGFALVLWWKMVRQDHEDHEELAHDDDKVAMG